MEDGIAGGLGVCADRKRWDGQLVQQSVELLDARAFHRAGEDDRHGLDGIVKEWDACAICNVEL